MYHDTFIYVHLSQANENITIIRPPILNRSIEELIQHFVQFDHERWGFFFVTMRSLIVTY